MCIGCSECGCSKSVSCFFQLIYTSDEDVGKEVNFLFYFFFPRQGFSM